MTRLLRVGDRVVFDGAEHQVSVLSGSWVRLVGPDGTPRAVMLTHLVASPDFDIVGGDPGEPRTVLADHVLTDLGEDVARRAREWERHIIEVETGLPPGAEPGTAPRSEYDPGLRGLQQRVAAKADELSASGIPASVATVQRMRRRYRAGGLRALVDGRSQRPVSSAGRADERVVAAIREALVDQLAQSTGTRDRLRHRVENILAQRHGAGAVPMPPKTTFGRLVNALSVGQHAFGTATTRRSTANRPEGPFTVTWAARLRRRSGPSGRADRGGGCRHPHDLRRGPAAGGHEGRGRLPSAGADAGSRADAARLGRIATDGGIKAAAPAAGRHRRADGAGRCETGRGPGDDRL